MEFVRDLTLLVVGLFGAMVLALIVGRRVGVRHLVRDPETALTGASTINGALFGLLGLLLAFTFSGAAARFDSRRNLIIDEANAIGTAYLRIDMLPESMRPPMRQLFRHYVDVRLQTYRVLPDAGEAKASLDAGARLQREIWARGMAAVQMPDAPASAAMVVLPALNSMFDIAATRTMIIKMHPPAIIYVMLFGLSVISALLAGYGMARRTSPSWMHVIGFAAVTSLAIFIIMNLEYPRRGLIHLGGFDQALVDLRAGMNAGVTAGR